MKEKLKDMISHVFGKYGMRKGLDNEFRMKRLLDFCMSDIESHPSLEESLKTKESLEFFVTQSIIYMMR
jgi:hypothetical protein